MNDAKKPFACSIKDCDMTFTNEDHLNWHQKKHDMMLNLGLANKQSEVADQTPTPTRFIRNCEEVGLFQDLQNVNPFDEFFKKAVEASKAGVTLEVQQSNNSEDTLHTPHILPHIEESQKALNMVEDGSNSHSNDFLQNMIPLTTNACELQAAKIVEPPVIIISDDDVEKQGRQSVKLKIKQVLEKKCKEKTTPTPTTPSIALVPITSLRPPKETNTNSKSPTTNTSREKRNEINRAAQERCRKRKRDAHLKMLGELKRLRVENERLLIENQFLKGQIQSKIEAENARINNSNVLPPVTIPIAIIQQKTEVKKSSTNLRKIFPKISAAKGTC